MEAQRQPLPIVRTKLHRPPVTADLVCRKRLHERLDPALPTPLMLVSAPAGYGKSVLVSQWAEELETPCAWLSLDKADSDLPLFLTYFVAAVESVSPGACRSSRDLLGAPELPPTSVVADYLINDLDAIDKLCPIVLDDYHRIDRSSPVHELIGRLLEHPPRQLHLVLATRRDPPLPLAGLRAGSRVTEVRLQDLRFSEGETADLLAATTGLAVGQDALANLQHEIEGWAVGLRLVSLALRHSDDPDGFLKNLRGGLPHTQEYLLQEVLAGLSPEFRECLLKSSILDRFCPELLEAVGTPSGPALSGREVVDQLRNSNLFTIPLDIQGEWLRYHHLFQELLQRELRRNHAPSDIADLHARAGEWFESRGLIGEAIEHAVAAEDAVRAAEIVERHRRTALDEDRWFVVESWLDLLPAEIKQQRVELLLTQAWVHWYQFKLADIARTLERIESLPDHRTVGPISMSEQRFFRAILLYWEGEGEESLRCCEEAYAQCSEKRGLLAGEIHLWLAMTRQVTGQAQSAIRTLEKESEAADPEDAMFLTRTIAAQAFVHLMCGDLSPAERAAQRVTSFAERISNPYAREFGHYLQALAQLHAHRLDDALQGFLLVAERRHIAERRAAADGLAGLALTHQLMQRPDLAAVAADELLAFARRLGEPQCVALAESARARLSLLQGDLDAAVDWARSAGAESHAPSMFFWLENPPLTRARVRIAEGTEDSVRQALESLGALRPQLEELHRTVQTIEVVVLQSLGLEKQGRIHEALATLEEAVALAGPRGWIRPFVEAGPEMAVLLRRLAGRGQEEDFIHRILAAFAPQATPSPTEAPLARTAEAPPARTAPDAITNREIDVLELLAQRLSNKEIAARLFISTHTVKDHLKRLYDKVGAHTRRQAVKRAVELGILSRR